MYKLEITEQQYDREIEKIENRKPVPRVREVRWAEGSQK